ncbi:SH3 domain-containing protein [Streptomyces gilvosporeus]|uniref:SH3 domain-containing protein n=1 Tax=Streptomyces gilvosporeus TaxID=553510 RepID=UPI000D1A0630|nr:SH3 domain-containing protein [Streptomyces gilvosporeus]
MRKLASKLTLAGLSVAFLGGMLLTPQAAQAAAGEPGRFIADADILASPDGALVGKGHNGQPVTVNCQSADGNWWNLNAPEAAGWVWQPNQVLLEYGSPNPPVC